MSAPPTIEQPLVSVIIPTYNRAGILPRLVEALADQTCPAPQYEIIIVDDGSGDDTPQVLQRLAAATPKRLIWKSQANAGPAAARNLGARTARGELLYFIDDDCLPGPDWLQQAITTFAEFPRPTALTSGISVADPDDPLNWYFRRQSEIVLASERQQEIRSCDEVVPGNCLVHQEDFWAAGGYDVERRVAESALMSQRLRAAGVSLMYVPQLRIPHLVEHRQTPADYFHYYAYTGAGNCQVAMEQNRRFALGQLLRITGTLLLIPLRLAKNLGEYRHTPFGVPWWGRFLLLDLAGLIGYRVGFWRRFLQGSRPKAGSVTGMADQADGPGGR